MLSLAALAALGNAHVFSRPMGITEVVLTLPQVAVGAGAFSGSGRRRSWAPTSARRVVGFVLRGSL